MTQAVPFPRPLGQSGLCCFLKLMNRQSRLQKPPLLLRWFSTVRFELSLATVPYGCFPQQVGSTLRVREITSNSPAPPCELHGAGATESHRAGRGRGTRCPLGTGTDTDYCWQTLHLVSAGATAEIQPLPDPTCSYTA